MSCTCSDCRPDLNLRATKSRVHATSFVSDCDVQFLCTGEWVFPSEAKVDTEVFYTEEYRYKYTKEKSRVDCRLCLEKLNKK